MDEVFTGHILKWRDNHQTGSLDADLRTRPGHWATVVYGIHGSRIRAAEGWLGLDRDEFEISSHAVDDGEYGVIYDIEARYVGRNNEHLPSWEREDER